MQMTKLTNAHLKFLKNNHTTCVTLPIADLLPVIDVLMTIAEDESQTDIVAAGTATICTKLIHKLADAESNQFWADKA